MERKRIQSISIAIASGFFFLFWAIFGAIGIAVSIFELPDSVTKVFFRLQLVSDWVGGWGVLMVLIGLTGLTLSWSYLFGVQGIKNALSWPFRIVFCRDTRRAEFLAIAESRNKAALSLRNDKDVSQVLAHLKAQRFAASAESICVSIEKIGKVSEWPSPTMNSTFRDYQARAEVANTADAMNMKGYHLERQAQMELAEKINYKKALFCEYLEAIGCVAARRKLQSMIDANISKASVRKDIEAGFFDPIDDDYLTKIIDAHIIGHQINRFYGEALASCQQASGESVQYAGELSPEAKSLLEAAVASIQI